MIGIDLNRLSEDHSEHYHRCKEMSVGSIGPHCNGLQVSMSHASQLIDRIHAIGTPRILVLGDVILDRYQWGQAERVSQEAPVILLKEQTTELRMGGAANVAHMLRGLEVDVVLAGVVGNDAEGQSLRELLESAKINCQGLLTDYFRPTTTKERIMGSALGRSPHQMLRIDRETREPLNQIMTTKILDRIIHQISKCDAVLISDYGKGVCTPEILERVIEISNSQNTPVIIDPALDVPLERYEHATTITPNRIETQSSTGIEIDSVSSAIDAGKILLEKTSVQNVMMTLDKEGIVLVDRNGTKKHFPTHMRSVSDITGAGDMVIAMVGASAASGSNPAEQIQLANIAGGLEVEQVGVACISKEEIISDLEKSSGIPSTKVYDSQTLSEKIRTHQTEGEKVVFTNGCFDLLHAGHITYLQEAAQLGDRLVVAINSDQSIRNLEKAAGRPICYEEERAKVLSALSCVDYVVVFGDSTPMSLLEQLKPDVLVKGGDYSPSQIVGRDFVESYGGEVRSLQFVQGVSTSDIIQRILDANKSDAPYIPFPQPERKAG